MKLTSIVALMLCVSACGGESTPKSTPLSPSERALAQKACDAVKGQEPSMTTDTFIAALEAVGIPNDGSNNANSDMFEVCPASREKIVQAIRTNDAPLVFSSEPSETRSDESLDAEASCEDYVKDRLKAPSGASFTGEQRFDLGEHQYKVTGAVDAANSFGARLQSRFACTVTIVQGTQARLDGLNIE